MEGFVEQFLRISVQDDHEFYELVNTYFRGRNALAIAFKEYQVGCYFIFETSSRE